MAGHLKPSNPFRWFGSSPEVIRLGVEMYVRSPPSPRNVEDLLVSEAAGIKRLIGDRGYDANRLPATKRG